jgi:hypothetical protein
LYNYKRFLESNYYKIEFDKEESDFKPWMDPDHKIQIKYHANKFERTASDEQAELLVASLFGAEIETRDAAFRDLVVIDPIPGVSIMNEYISVKSSQKKHSLEATIGNTNGFKINSLILFMMEKLHLRIYLNEKFIERNLIDYKVIFNYYKTHIYNLYYVKGGDLSAYIFAYTSCILVFKIIKDFLEELVEKREFLEGSHTIRNVIAMALTAFMDHNFKDKSVQNFPILEKRIKVLPHELEEFMSIRKQFAEFFQSQTKKNLYTIRDGYNYIDETVFEKFREIKLSYCVVFFDKTNKKTGEETINIYKTQAVSCADLFKKTSQIWTAAGNFEKAVVYKKRNIYLPYNLIVQAFSGNGLVGRDVFETVITIKLPKDWNLRYKESGFVYAMKMFKYKIWKLNQPGYEEEAKKFGENNPETQKLFPHIAFDEPK